MESFLLHEGDSIENPRRPIFHDGSDVLALSFDNKLSPDNSRTPTLITSSGILANPIIPVSVGELFDKYTILQIKQERIQDIVKLNIINKELEYLEPFINNYTLDEKYIVELKNTNQKLWDIEDKIREKEMKKEFDAEFIELARNVYITNDKRNVVKQTIDKICLSELSDVKSYVSY